MPRRHKSPHPKTPRKPRPPDVPATHRATATSPDAGQPRGIPTTAPHAIASGTAALDLTAPAATSSLADAILEIVGADHATLRSALAAWQGEQDRIANRAWRRPGGLARPAGL